MKVRLCFLFALLLGCGVGVQAQSAPAPSTLNMAWPNTTNGIYPYATVEENNHERLSLATGTLSFSLPVVTLPQRGGRSLHIGFVYQSNAYALKETGDAFTEAEPDGPTTTFLAPTQETIQWEQTSTQPWNAPLHANLPTLTADLSYAGAFQEPVGCPQGSPCYEWFPDYCTQNWVFTDWDGSTHSF